MKNFKQAGSTLKVVAPYTLTAGQGFKVGSLIGIAQNNVDNGADALMFREGVFEVAKDASAPAQGDLAYWDNTAKKFTTTSTSNSKAGVFTAAALTGDATALVLLVPAI